MAHSNRSMFSDYESSWQWWLVWGLGVTGFVAGATGLALYEQEHFGHFRPASVLYHTLQMFVLHTPHFEHPPNWAMELGRWSAAAAGLALALMTLSRMFWQEWKLLWLWRYENHVVVCGLGEVGLRLALEYRRAEKKRWQVIAIENRGQPEAIVEAQRAGIPVIVGDARDPASLRRARVHVARHILAACTDHESNAMIAATVGDLTRDRPAGLAPLDTWLFITDPHLRESLQTRGLLPGPATRHRVNVRGIDIHDVSARAALERHPLDFRGIRPGDPIPVRLVIVGLGPMGRSLALHAARLAHFADARKLTLTLLDAVGAATLTRTHPALADVCTLDPWSPPSAVDLATALVDRFLPKGQPIQEWLTFAVCYENVDRRRSGVDSARADDDRNFALGVMLAREVRDRLSTHSVGASGNAQVLVYLKQRAGYASLLDPSGEHGGIRERLHAFGMVEDISSRSRLIEEDQDRLAQALHQDFLDQNPGREPWEILPEEYRESNRQAADHIPVKLRALGHKRAPLKGRKDPLAAIPDDQVETLAEMEHRRWCAERLLAGWVVGPRGTEPDRIRKIHPDLVPWADLPPAAKQKDRDQVRAIPKVLGAIKEGIFPA